MKILLYFEGQSVIGRSGIGRALEHQKRALASVGIKFTLDPNDEDYDILHINTYGPRSISLIHRAKRLGKKIIYHAHSTEEDFRNSFIGSNQAAPFVKKWLVYLYSKGDHLITPTPYSKKLLEGYGLNQPIAAISNGIDLKRYYPDSKKEQKFREYFSLTRNQKVIISVGLFFERKGLIDFVTIAKKLPEYTFIWFGDVPMFSVPPKIRKIVKYDHPKNVIFPGYIDGDVIEGAYSGADLFFFPSYEETEGIVVLEALASQQQVLLRDIPVYHQWMENQKNCYMGNSIEDFCLWISKIVEQEVPDLTRNGFRTAQSKSIMEIGRELKAVYQKVLGETFDTAIYQRVIK
ncbi:glycosyl transferase [Enterococcus florum]|uniref:Glycosyl transferase n=1 Tax=Enterococcus florum TaxID=2480627 RepID=A0A4P5PFT0_9ENTE|nr:glycosyltransferase [Enterococcus florum]GCF92343.1 glycosyl transferase [Enterococcus florum]